MRGVQPSSGRHSWRSAICFARSFARRKRSPVPCQRDSRNSPDHAVARDGGRNTAVPEINRCAGCGRAIPKQHCRVESEPWKPVVPPGHRMPSEHPTAGACPKTMAKDVMVSACCLEALGRPWRGRGTPVGRAGMKMQTASPRPRLRAPTQPSPITHSQAADHTTACHTAAFSTGRAWSSAPTLPGDEARAATSAETKRR